MVVFNATLQQNLSIARPKASSQEMKEAGPGEVMFGSENLGPDVESGNYWYVYIIIMLYKSLHTHIYIYI